MIYLGPLVIFVGIVAALGWRVPRLAAEAALAGGVVAIVDAVVYFAAFASAPRENGCVTTHSSVWHLQTTFFLVGAVAAAVAAGAGLAAAIHGERPARSLGFAVAGVAAGIVCFVLLLFIALCGD